MLPIQKIVHNNEKIVSGLRSAIIVIYLFSKEVTWTQLSND